MGIAVIVIVVLLGGVAVLAAAKPDTFRVERSIDIKAPPEKILVFIEDFHRWGLWSPYEKLDPSMQRNFSGAATGKSSVYSWASDGKAGAGRMEITDVSPSRVLIQLDFSKPFESHNLAEFTLTPSGDATNPDTKVIWAMYGPNLFIGKVMSLFFDTDKMIGGDFETGLANLKAQAEKTD
ncbi:SRPBCC family protein [Dongia soli]|uniref:SRPBCC family protein n=1 Tax=Dongia soli TaxID=600628 RepID=A0ABU5EE56_9PROT|nr:SRPBCC family protein [Dongia soli]MDY0884498.1 SRPBCC family protein [Dongia soli]